MKIIKNPLFRSGPKNQVSSSYMFNLILLISTKKLKSRNYLLVESNRCMGKNKFDEGNSFSFLSYLAITLVIKFICSIDKSG